MKLEIETTEKIIEAEMKISETIINKIKINKNSLSIPNLSTIKIYRDWQNKRWISEESLLRFFEVAMNEETGEVDWNMCQELKMKLEK